jgi:colanic acid/amylovoran biosynthesis glycosyltransferase
MDPTSITLAESSLLLEVGVPFRRGATGLLVEAQALNGIRLWAKHFSRVTVCAPLTPSDHVDTSSIVWADPHDLLETGRVAFEPLPWGYHPRDHFRHRIAVRRRFQSLVRAHRYLCFSNLGVFGTWGNFGVRAARQQKRAYSLWFDWVLHDMAVAQEDSLGAKVRTKIFSSLTKYISHRAVRACSLGLFHGQTVFDAYAAICKEPALVHDIHVHPEDAISDDELDFRLRALSLTRPLRLGYVGRTHPMKAPLQWVDAIAKAIAELGEGRIEATWLGDGPLLRDVRDHVKALRLENAIHFKGFVADRSEVLSFLRSLDMLVFTHITPESPRSLIEALISGLPLVGYDSSYARELGSQRGGTVLSPVGDVGALASELIRLAKDPSGIVKLTREAATARAIYNDETVFAHRSALIKRYL